MCSSDLVTFGSIADPASVVRVDPANLLASFGVGVMLKRISVEKTSDPVTVGIGNRLGWVAAHRGALVYGDRLHPNNPEKDITKSAFMQGDVR